MPLSRLILVHLYETREAAPGHPQPYALTREGIALTLGTTPPRVSDAVAGRARSARERDSSLLNRGLVRAERSPVAGPQGQERARVFHLTPAGRAAAESAKRELESTKVALSDSPGESTLLAEIASRSGFGIAQAAARVVLVNDAPTLSTSSLKPRDAEPQRAPIAGRERDLARADARLKDAEEGRGGLLALSGEPGAGKTRLLEEICDRASKRRFEVLRGHCLPLADELPYLAIAAALGRRFPLQMLRGRALAEGTRGEESLFVETLETLGRLAMRRPVLLAIDDIHWASSSAVALLQFIAVRAPRLRLLVLVTVRSDGSARLVRRLMEPLSREGGAEVIELGRLGRAAVGEMMRSSGSRTSEDEVESVWKLSEGNPLFVRLLVEYGPGPHGVPEGIEALVGRAVRSLSAEEREIAELLAVSGGGGRAAELAGACGLPAQKVDSTLAALASSGLLIRDPARDSYRYWHHLVGDAIASGIPESRRREMHSRMASTLISTPQAPGPGLVAHHLEGAGESKRAAAYALEAARLARNAMALSASADLYRRANELAGEPDANALGEEADVLNSLGRWEEAMKRYDLAAAASGASEEQAGLVHCRRAYCRGRLGRFAEATKILESLEKHPSPLVRATAEVVAVEEAAREGRLELGLELSKKAEASVKELGPAAPPALVADLHNAIGSALGLLRRGEESEGHFRTAMAAAELSGNPVRAATIATNCSVYLMDQGRLDEAIELLQGREPDLRRHGDTVMLATLLNNLAALHILAADVDGGKERLEEALRIYTLLGDAPNGAAVRYNLGILEALRDRAPGAARQFEEALRLLEEAPTALPEPAATVSCLVKVGLAEARNMQGKRALASPLLDQVEKCEACKSKAVVQTRLMIARSRAAQQSRRFEETVEYAQRAVSAAGDRGEEGALAACRLALALAVSGKEMEAMHQAREAERLAAGFPVHAHGFRKAFDRAVGENRKRRDATPPKTPAPAGEQGGGSDEKPRRRKGSLASCRGRPGKPRGPAGKRRARGR